jgi:hypothetical protein
LVFAKLIMEKPKRPVNGWIRFLQAALPRHKDKYPDLPYQKRIKILSKIWKEDLCPLEKESFNQMFHDEYPSYKIRLEKWEDENLVDYSPTPEKIKKPVKRKTKTQVTQKVSDEKSDPNTEDEWGALYNWDSVSKELKELIPKPKRIIKNYKPDTSGANPFRSYPKEKLWF